MCMNRGVLNQISAWSACSWVAGFRSLGPVSVGNSWQMGPRPGACQTGRGPEHVVSSAVKQAGSFTGPASSQREQGTWEPSWMSLCLRVLHHCPQRMMPLVQATGCCHPLWPKQKELSRHMSPALHVTHIHVAFPQLLPPLAVLSFLVCEDSLRRSALSRNIKL